MRERTGARKRECDTFTLMYRRLGKNWGWGLGVGGWGNEKQEGRTNILDNRNWGILPVESESYH